MCRIMFSEKEIEHGYLHLPPDITYPHRPIGKLNSADC